MIDSFAHRARPPKVDANTKRSKSRSKQTALTRAHGWAARSAQTKDRSALDRPERSLRFTP